MDRRFVLAIVLMMAVLLVPPLFLKRPPRRPAAGATADTLAPRSPQPPPQNPTIGPAERPNQAPNAVAPVAGSAEEDTVTVISQLYSYQFSTRGGRLVGAELRQYKSMRKDEKGRPAQVLPANSQVLALGLLVGRDTVRLANLPFKPSAERVDVTGPDAALTFTAPIDSAMSVELTYRFVPNDYRIGVTGQVKGLGPNGGTLVIGLGPGLRNTESDSVEHSRELGLVTKDTRSQITRFAKLKLGETLTLDGPFEWAAVKSKYFVSAIIAPDSGKVGRGRITGLQARATDPLHRSPEAADVNAGLSLSGGGDFGFALYVGPMEYPRLNAIGHDFDDINPYGWAWLRPIIRPVAIGARWLLVWLHESLGLAYGLALVLFGVLIRLVLWPLNQKAMRASMAMQAIQPALKEVQDKYQGDPQRLQQEMFKLYKEHKVNPFSGCWPLLLPWPILIALFFVFQNSIELRGQSFLWIPDLSRPDPLYIIPVIMAVSMFGVTKVGQLGMPPNPQTKMMLYFMPVMMLVLFLNFASGLNLYYAVQNLTSIPQQWWIAKARMKNAPVAPPAPPRIPAKLAKK
jgi:YidC/Oxa1 family membrane protein insertase